MEIQRNEFLVERNFGKNGDSAEQIFGKMAIQ